MDQSTTSKRIPSIDVFRALTMLLMIYVNDLWTLKGVPHWLEHAETHEDFLGLSDVVFPAFLFIMGLAIPYALRNRLSKGDPGWKISWHIILRSFALIVMGLFTVNIGGMNRAAMGMSTEWFEILMVTGFFMVWNVYPKAGGWKRNMFSGLQVAGVILLIWLAVIYRSGGQDGMPLGWMKTKWWGILGLIGWAYLGSALIYLLARNKVWILVLAWIFFTVMTIAAHAGWLKALWPEGPDNWIVGNGAFHSFAMAGVLTAMLADKYAARKNIWPLLGTLLAASLLLLAAGIISRHYFIMSKNLATPTWIFTSLSISIAFYAFIYWLVDRQGKVSWFNIIRPAGTATLTCYLIPYFIYSFRDIFNIVLPEVLKTGIIGLIKSLVYALIVIGITYLLNKAGIKLKI